MRIMCKRLLFVLLALVVGVTAWAGQPPSSPQGFVPASSLPPTEQIPAAPLVVAAYAFVWIAVFVYLWSIWRRLQKVHSEIETLQRRAAKGSSGGTR
jgi:CcmD family protein